MRSWHDVKIQDFGVSEIIIFTIKNEDWLARGVKNVIGLPRPVPYEIDLQQSTNFISWAQTLGIDVVAVATFVVETLPFRIALPVAKPVTLPASIRLFADIVGTVFTSSGAVIGVDTLPFRIVVPVEKPITDPESIKFVTSIIGPPAAKLAVFHVFAFAFSHAVGYIYIYIYEKSQMHPDLQ